MLNRKKRFQRYATLSNSKTCPVPVKDEQTFLLIESRHHRWSTNHISLPLLFCSFLLGTKADRLLRLQQAAELYLTQVVEVRTFVGIVTFGSKGEIRAQLQQMNTDDDRRRLVSYLPTSVSTEEEANTCAGVKRGFEVVYPRSQPP